MNISCTSTMLLCLSISLSACSPGCENEQIQSHSSPGGTRKAVVFQRNCGATTGFNTQISVISTGANLPEEASVLVVNGKAPIKVQWKSETSLSISELPSKEIIRQEREAEGVRITYE